MTLKIRAYQKTEVAISMLETAIDLFLGNGCKFSALQLAAASEELIAGLIKAGNSNEVTGREKAKQWLAELHKAYGNEKIDKQIGDSLNEIRNQTKHHSPNDPVELVVCIEKHASAAIGRAIDNYLTYYGEPTEKNAYFIHLWSKNEI